MAHEFLQWGCAKVESTSGDREPIGEGEGRCVDAVFRLLGVFHDVLYGDLRGKEVTGSPFYY